MQAAPNVTCASPALLDVLRLLHATRAPAVSHHAVWARPARRRGGLPTDMLGVTVRGAPGEERGPVPSWPRPADSCARLLAASTPANSSSACVCAFASAPARYFSGAVSTKRGEAASARSYTPGDSPTPASRPSAIPKPIGNWKLFRNGLFVLDRQIRQPVGNCLCCDCGDMLRVPTNQGGRTRELSACD